MLKDKIDGRINQIFEMLEQGRDRESISEELGYKNHKSLDAYLRRNGFMWDKRFSRYVSTLDGALPTNEDIAYGTSGKAREVILGLSRGMMDLKQLAQQNGFRDHRELAEYMTLKGYVWDNEKSNYFQAVDFEDEKSIYNEENVITVKGMPWTNVSSERDSFIDFLFENRERLLALIAPSSDESIPQYMIPGILVTKSVHMTNLLDQMVRDFSQEKNVKQRVIFEIALLDFFKKYGYVEEVNRMLK